MNHKDLDVWKESFQLVKTIYQHTKTYPKSEVYGLTTQIRRAVVSIPSNIAEGAARSSDKEFIQFLYIALGSLSELETHILLVKELQLSDNIEIEINKIETVRKLILGLIKYLKNK